MLLREAIEELTLRNEDFSDCFVDHGDTPWIGIQVHFSTGRTMGSEPYEVGLVIFSVDQEDEPPTIREGRNLRQKVAKLFSCFNVNLSFVGEKIVLLTLINP